MDCSRKFLTSRQLLDTWWINQASYLASGVFLPRQLLDTWSVDVAFLDTYSTDVSTPPRHLICQDLLMDYIFFSCDLQLISIDLSLDTSVFSPPKPFSLTPNLFPWDSQAFSSFSSLGKLLISFIYMHFMFWNLGFGVFEKFWGFSKLMKFCWNFGLVFEDLILKTSCIALHLHYNSIIMHLDVCNLFVCW